MTINPTDHAVHAVRPVVDYEPPARDVRHCAPPSPVLRRRTARFTRDCDNPKPADAMSPTLRPAAVFADAALRRVLEVIDRRRPVSQLRPLLSGPLVDSVLAANRMTAGHHTAAVLRRLRLQAVSDLDSLRPVTAAEVFGTYSRGRRIHAIACRVARVRVADAAQWQVVALHIG